MSRTRRSFTPEFKVEAARLVIDGGRRVAEVARKLDVHENQLRKWVAAERVRDGAVADSRNVPPDGELSAAERSELTRLRAEVVEKDRDIAFLKKSRRTLRHSNTGESVQAHRTRSAPTTTYRNSPNCWGFHDPATTRGRHGNAAPCSRHVSSGAAIWK